MPITSIVSINQLITWFEDFQENHYFLKDFGFGEPYDIGTSVQMEFPYMWVTLNEDSSIATGSNVKSAIPDISFSVMFMDKINDQPNYLDTNGFQSDNSQEILSDTLQCLQDLITMIQQNWGQYGVLISQDVSFYPAIDETQDKATGIVARIVLRTRQVNCVIPESPNTIVVQPNQPTYATLLTCENLIDCATFQTYAYTGGTYNSGTTELTITSINGHSFSISGITGGGGGASGTSGSSGVSGSSGTSGISGTSGTSGLNGTSGTSGQSGLSNSFFNYQAKTTITTGDPASGHLIWNSATQSGATQISISETDQANNNIDIFLSNLVSGSTITIQDQTNHTNYQTWIIGAPIDNTTYWSLPVTLVTSTYSFSNNQDVLFIITTVPSGTSGTSGISGTSGTSGQNGTSGTSGESGTSGTSGPAGATGTSGTSGDNGTSGTSGTGFSSPFIGNVQVTSGQTWVTLPSTGTTTANTTIDWNNGNVQHITLGVATTTFTFSNPQAGATYILVVRQQAGGSGTIVWPGTVAWSGAATPVMTATANRYDVYTFVYDGVKFYGSYVQNFT